MERLRRFGCRLMANPIFWIAVVLCSLGGFIGFFERYTRIGTDNLYNLF